MSYKGTDIENKGPLAPAWTKPEQRLVAVLEECETLLSQGRKIDPSDFESALGDLDKSIVSARQDYFRASAADDAQGCKVKAELQTRANTTRARLIASQGLGMRQGG
jgi:hypothetical protein